MAEEALFREVCEYSMSNHFNTSEETGEDVSFPLIPEYDDVVVAAAAPLRPKIALLPLAWPLPRCCSSLSALATMSLTNTYRYMCMCHNPQRW